MTSDPANAPPASPPSSPTPTVSPPSPPTPRHVRRTVWYAAAAVALVLAIFGIYWLTYRLSHSITEDAFVEAHIVNIAPQTVSGHLVRFLVEENDRVEPGQVLAEIDPVPYRDQVALARSQLDAAEAELVRQRAAPDRVR